MDEKDPYTLTRGPMQLTRVNLLQLLWQDTSGYLLHPVTEKEKTATAIADVATATGLWLCALANQSQGKRELYGLDISSDTFIQEDWLPKDVKLVVADGKEPPPDHLKGKFDIVHIRLIQSVILKNDPEWMIEHALTLLKPGGFLQWEEFDPLAVEIHGKEGQTENLKKLTDILQSRVEASWMEQLPQRMEKMGMTVKAVERKRQANFHNTALTYLHCLVFEEYAETILTKTGPPGAAEALIKVAKDGFNEGLGGSYVSYCFQTVVGQKPL